MATIFDLFEVTDISPHSTYSTTSGNLLGVVDNVSSTDLNDGEFDQGDFILIGGTSYTIDLIQEPQSSGRFTLGNGTDVSFDPGSESNLEVVFLTVSNGTGTRYFIVPNDSYGDMNVQSIRTGEIGEVGGNDAAIISTTDNDNNVVCFVSGTMIETPDGPVPIEDLRVGDQVLTRDNGQQEVRMILVRQLDFTTETEKLKPICFEPNSLGAGCPSRRLCVSPQHRMLVMNEAGTELLVPAKSLTDRKGIRVMKGKQRVTYLHLVFDGHEIIISNGTFTESFFPGPVALAAIPKEAREEVLGIFGMKTGHQPNQPPLPAAQMCSFQGARRFAKSSSAVRPNEKTGARPESSCAS